MATIAAASPSAYWFITRGSGVVTLILLTLSVALGVANVQRLQTARVPRFVINAVHRNASLLAVVFLAIHIVTTVLDSYVKISLIDAVVPFGAGYRPLWVGLGAVALDLMLAVVVTSLLRRHIGYRAWRATHWLAYACWPIALLHGIGTGTDAGATWMQVVTGICVAIVAAALLSRLSQGDVDRRRGTSDGYRVGGRAGDQHRTAVARRANPAGKPPVTDRQALAGHAAAVPVGERV
ncbi:MAG: ferric reductase-like transmembrane domain-containing protein [Solirubrobacteraceae bacterium]